ncbi:MAG: GDP-mannose 4,6-dehydratase, partial [Bacteroidia bacterium]|nr:GDP-mannose 4,6-dehydratase [Bacteroidia bacterium]
GSLGETGYFTEETPYQPHSPYSASKASSDHFVRAWHDTYQLPILISNCSNNYGPYQFPEKLIPLTIRNGIEGKPIPVYGKGENVRDWLYVEDHCAAIDLLFHQGRIGETYNIGGKNPLPNLFVVQEICRILDYKLNRPAGSTAQQIQFVTDRPGHDFRYAIDCSKLEREFGWQPTRPFSQGLELTIDWYLSNDEWLQSTLSGDYQRYYEEQYQHRIFS